MGTTVDTVMATFSVSREYASHIVALLNLYAESGFTPPNTAGEVRTRVPEKLQAVIWEAMLYWHFRNLGAQFRTPLVKKSGQSGPDLCVDCNGRRIWIEAVVATPRGLPGDWLAPVLQGEFRPWEYPHEEMLLRYTSALADKKKQLDKRCAKGIVGADDAYVIAVNGCMLSRVPECDSHGNSGWPFIVEAVFPIGPVTVPVDPKTNRFGQASNSLRFTITKPNKSSVPLDSFLNDDWNGVSAALWCGQRDHLSGRLNLVVVHNPKARAPIPRGFLGSDPQYEYVAEEDGEGGYTLEKPATT